VPGTKSRKPTIEIVENWIKKWNSSIKKGSYISFLKVRDVPSLGLSTMVLSNITKREHHYLSKLEYKAHLLSEYQSATINIREQYPLLPWEETQAIAENFGIKHPKYPQTMTPIVMTTDLLITLKSQNGQKLIAISVKPKKDLTPVNLEKLLIEKMYWKARGVTWILVTEDELPKALTDNLHFFSSPMTRTNIDAEINPQIFSAAFENHHTKTAFYTDILHETSQEFGIDVITGHFILSKAIWSRQSKIDIFKNKISHRENIHLL
jgi:hypothetical protein